MHHIALALLGSTLLAAPALAETHFVDRGDGVDVDVDVRVTVKPGLAPRIEAPAPLPPPALQGSRWEMSIRGTVGRHAVTDASGPGGGVDILAGKQFGSIRLGIEAGYSRVSLTRGDDLLDTIDGEVARVGAAARFRAGPIETTPPMGRRGYFGVYAEIALGAQRVRWSDGVEATRADLGIGLGMEAASGLRRFGGVDLGVRMLLSRSSPQGLHCDQACRGDASDWAPDIGILLVLGALFGG